MLPIEREVLQIERFRHPEGGAALSLYLDTNPSRGPGSNVRAQLEDVLRPIRASLDGDSARVREVESAAESAMSAIAALESPPRAVAVFVCPDFGFLRVVPLPEPVAPAALWGPALLVKPLLAALDEHERTIVVLVDKEHGRVFRVFMGQIEEVAHFTEEAEKHSQAGRSQQKFSGGVQGGSVHMGYGESNIQRRHEWHIRQHLERVIGAFRRDNSAETDRFLMGGGEETVYELLRLLPKRIRDRTRLISGLAVDASLAKVLARVSEMQRESEREREEELLDNLTERDRARSVFGATAVAEAVSDARVHTLVFGADTAMEGSECTSCGWIIPGRTTESCSRCGAPMRTIPDLVEHMVSRVVHAGGRVEEVRGPALRTLNKSQGLAALLRYVPAKNGNSPMRPAPAAHPSRDSRA